MSASEIGLVIAFFALFLCALHFELRLQKINKAFSHASLTSSLTEALTHEDFKYESLAVKPIRFGPGDVIIVTVPGVCRHDSIQRLKTNVKQYFPDNEVLILSGGLELSVAEKKDDA